MNYEKDLQIDEASLNFEWLKQPQLFFRYAQLAAQADAEVAKAKEDFDVKRAEVDAEIREDARIAEEKITEKVVESRLLQSKKYQSALQELNDKRLELGVLQAAVRAMEQRKSALENLVKLYIAGYFGTPKEPQEMKISVKEKVADERQYKKFDEKKKSRR